MTVNNNKESGKKKGKRRAKEHKIYQVDGQATELGVDGMRDTKRESGKGKGFSLSLSWS